MTITEPDLVVGGPEAQHLNITAHPATIEEIDAIMDAVEAERAKGLLRPTEQQVLDTIVSECLLANLPCSQRQARQILGYFCRLNATRRAAGLVGIHDHLSDRQIHNFHPQLDAWQTEIKGILGLLEGRLKQGGCMVANQYGFGMLASNDAIHQLLCLGLLFDVKNSSNQIPFSHTV